MDLAMNPERGPESGPEQGPERAIADVRPITDADIRWALSEGWKDYRERRGELLLLPVIYVMVGVLAGFIAFKADLFPFFFPLAAGFALVGPIAAAGFYELARRRQAGEPSQWNHFFDPLSGPARWPLLALAAVLAGLFLCWLWAAGAIYTATLATVGAGSPEQFLGQLFSTPEGLSMVILGNGVGALFAFAALVLSAFSFPMAVDVKAHRAADPFATIGTSIAVFRKSPVTVLKWGFVVAVLLLLGILPLFVGLMVALPVLGYATWHLYTRAVVR
jgi:uncharacterized membrane protein